MDLITIFTKGIVNPLLKLILAAAVIYFFWGVIKYFIGAHERSDSAEASEGRAHMLWGIIGIAVIISVMGIKELIQNFVDTVGK